MRLVTTGTSKHDWRVQRSEQSRQAPAANSVVVGRYGAMHPIESMVMKHLGDPQWSWGQLSERKQYVFCYVSRNRKGSKVLQGSCFVFSTRNMQAFRMGENYVLIIYKMVICTYIPVLVFAKGLVYISTLCMYRKYWKRPKNLDLMTSPLLERRRKLAAVSTHPSLRGLTTAQLRIAEKAQLDPVSSSFFDNLISSFFE